MTWTTKAGQPLPFEMVFAAQLWGLKRRLGGSMSRAAQRRARHQQDQDGSMELVVRTAAGTHVYTEGDQ